MSADWQILIRLSLYFSALFALAEVLYHFLKVKAEYTRKITHVGTGLLTLLFPLYFHHLWQVVVICGAFLGLLALSLRFRFLPSINAIERKSAGSILYPIVVVIIFTFYIWMNEHGTIFHSFIYFYLPVLLMAICDPLAALSGNAYKRKHPANGKTWVGSIVFFAAACILSWLLLDGYYYGDGGILITVLYAVCISAVATITERITGGGWDNFTIPVAVAASLYIISNIAA
jgi:dolichol kinase